MVKGSGSLQWRVVNMGVRFTSCRCTASPGLKDTPLQDFPSGRLQWGFLRSSPASRQVCAAQLRWSLGHPSCLHHLQTRASPDRTPSSISPGSAATPSPGPSRFPLLPTSRNPSSHASHTSHPSLRAQELGAAAEWGALPRRPGLQPHLPASAFLVRSPPRPAQDAAVAYASNSLGVLSEPSFSQPYRETPPALPPQ